MATVEFEKRYYLMPRAGIGLLRFLLEGYDGLAFARTLDRHAGLVEVAFPGDRAPDAGALLDALAGELGMRAVPPPEQVPPL